MVKRGTTDAKIRGSNPLHVRYKNYGGFFRSRYIIKSLNYIKAVLKSIYLDIYFKNYEVRHMSYIKLL